MDSIIRHEWYIGSRLCVSPGDHVLDVGCGVGGPMRNIARFTKARITGINNNAYQLKRVAAKNAAEGLAQQCSGVKGDFMNMPFDDNTFDGVYAIEATVHAPSLAGVYAEIFRVLKPGKVFCV
jgi:sterol 24-C-methyltransferase